MSRLFRILRSSIALVSLLLCIAAIVLWVRSYSGSDYISWRKLLEMNEFSVTHDHRMLSCTRGRLRWSVGKQVGFFQTATMAGKEPIGTSYWGYGRLGVGHLGWELPDAKSIWNRLGFDEWRDGFSTSFASENEHVRTVPLWLAVLIFAIAPMMWARRVWRTRRRYRAGLCQTCGYDLRATPDRCPECGTIRAVRRA